MFKDVGLCGEQNKMFQIRTSLENSGRRVHVPAAVEPSLQGTLQRGPACGTGVLLASLTRSTLTPASSFPRSSNSCLLFNTQPGSSSYKKLPGVHLGLKFSPLKGDLILKHIKAVWKHKHYTKKSWKLFDLTLYHISAKNTMRNSLMKTKTAF